MVAAKEQATVEEFATASARSRSRLKGVWFQGDELADHLDFGIATDSRALDQAFRLQHDQYVAHGYMDPHPTGWRLSLYNALPETRVFVARLGDRVVATMTLIPDSPLGLPMDEIYRDELRQLREEGRDLAEVSGLAVARGYHSSGIAILLRLTRMMVIHAVRTENDLCIAVNPHHAMFYRKAFHFQDIGGLKQYRKVNGAPAVALRLDLALARSLINELREGHHMISGVHRFLFDPANVERVIARLTEDSARTLSLGELLQHFFLRHNALQEASKANRRYILGRRGSTTNPLRQLVEHGVSV